MGREVLSLLIYLPGDASRPLHPPSLLFSLRDERNDWIRPIRQIESCKIEGNSKVRFFLSNYVHPLGRPLLRHKQPSRSWVGTQQASKENPIWQVALTSKLDVPRYWSQFFFERIWPAHIRFESWRDTRVWACAYTRTARNERKYERH